MEDVAPAAAHPGTEKAGLVRHLSRVSRYGSVAGAQLDMGPSSHTAAISPRRAHLAVAVLCYVNLLNYMDRYTIAGVLSRIQTFFGINNSTSGLLQTVFICSFMLLAPVFGYLGDRYNRKLIMVVGLSVWLVTTLGSSFIAREEDFWLLVLMRALIGTGEASYSTIAPTIIGDLFTGTKRTLMISYFYIFIPVGSGLGYIAGSKIANATGDWRWALRLNPILGSVGLLLLLIFIPNPPRGAADSKEGVHMEQTSYCEDVRYLLKNRTFVWSTLGVTAMAFVTGALAFWTPLFLCLAQNMNMKMNGCSSDSNNSFIFGLITVATGIVGVAVGTWISRRLRDRVANADPIICAVGMLSSAPCFFLAILLASNSIAATYTFIAIGETLLSLNWAILADILLYVVVPTRRATAEALQIMVCHLLGDAGSPYLLGMISDALNKYEQQSFRSLQYSFFLCPFVGVLGGLFFLMAALYIKNDRKTAEILTAGHDPNPDVEART
ncbi:LOW QUALITY PROTEIN: protein spinster homolog 3 [Denticeps clupeoides]|uniref:LOW QUALITY PROTEIN: protein spinster homolog 3 n=1 Tax=Denticeps clupeoides TaxID=299321 RepID=UPI0010A36A50|nr:LOW QUALITY PROTEIN: protein spinster homolog 3-like [Denticeps clupeoides]